MYMSGRRSAPNRKSVILLASMCDDASHREAAVQVLLQARTRGFTTHLVADSTYLSQSPEINEVADILSQAEITDICQTSVWASRLRRVSDPIAVFGVSEITAEAVSKLAWEMGLPGGGPLPHGQGADGRGNGISHVPSSQCHSLTEVLDFHQGLREGCPIRLTGDFSPRLSSIADNPQDLESLFHALRAWGPVLSEEAGAGAEYTVEGFFRDGVPQVIAVAERQRLDVPPFTETGVVLPARVSDAAKERIERSATSVLTDMRLSAGLFHVEVQCDDHQVVVRDVQTHHGEKWTHALLAHAIPGIELWGVVLDDIAGSSSPGPLPTLTQAVALRYLTGIPGRGIREDLWGRLLSHPDVVRAELTTPFQGGDSPPSFSEVPHGMFIVEAPSPGEASERARQVAALVGARS